MKLHLLAICYNRGKNSRLSHARCPKRSCHNSVVYSREQKTVDFLVCPDSTYKLSQTTPNLLQSRVLSGFAMLFVLIFLHLNLISIASITFAFPSDSRARSLAVLDTISTGAILSQLKTTSLYSTATTDTTQLFPIHCFNPEPITLNPTVPEDCDVVIDNIILRLVPDPMAIQTWGYTDDQDINLSLDENEKWYYRECVIFVRAVKKTQVDRFRMVDVALAAQQILHKCVTGSKFAKGGTADIGTFVDGFYIVLGGLISEAVANDTVPFPASNKTVLSLSRNTERSMTLGGDTSGASG